MPCHLSLTFDYVQPIEGSNMQLITAFQSLNWKHPLSHQFLVVLGCVFEKKWNFVSWSVNNIELLEFLTLSLGDYKVQNYKIDCKKLCSEELYSVVAQQYSALVNSGPYAVKK